MFEVWTKELDRAEVLKIAKIAKSLAEYDEGKRGERMGFNYLIDALPENLKIDYVSLEEQQKASGFEFVPLPPFEFTSESVNLSQAAIQEVIEFNEEYGLSLRFNIVDSLESSEKIKQEEKYLWINFPRSKYKNLLSVEVMLGDVAKAHRDQTRRAAIYNEVFSLLNVDRFVEVYRDAEFAQVRALSDVPIIDQFSNIDGLKVYIKNWMPSRFERPVDKLSFINCLKREDFKQLLNNIASKFSHDIIQQEVTVTEREVENLDVMRKEFRNRELKWKFDHVCRNPFSVKEISKNSNQAEDALIHLFMVRIPKHRTVFADALYSNGSYKLIFNSGKKRGTSEDFKKILSATFEGCSLFN